MGMGGKEGGGGGVKEILTTKRFKESVERERNSYQRKGKD